MKIKLEAVPDWIKRFKQPHTKMSRDIAQGLLKATGFRVEEQNRGRASDISVKLYTNRYDNALQINLPGNKEFSYGATSDIVSIVEKALPLAQKYAGESVQEADSQEFPLGDATCGEVLASGSHHSARPAAR